MKKMEKEELNKTTLQGITLHPGQVRIAKGILTSDAFYHTVCTGRQFGKSALAVQLALYYCLNNRDWKVMITSPTYAQVTKIYGEIVDGLADGNFILKKNAASNSITFINGTELYFRSTQIAENLRGYSLDVLICDEASMYRDDDFNKVLRPMLLVRGKRCILFSTPKGNNYFHSMYLKGLDPNEPRYASYRATYLENPFASEEEVNDARKSLPENIFKQEYEALFVSDSGSVFSGVDKVCVIEEWPAPSESNIYYVGIDIAISNDYFVATVIDRMGNVVFVYRDTRKSISYMLKQLEIIFKKYNPRSTYVETNGIGLGIYEYIQKLHRSVSPFVTTNETKQNIIEDLIFAIQEGEIKLPTKALFSAISDEMDTFSYSYSPKSRKIVYGAINGANDDTVMSLAIALNAKKTGLNRGIYAIA